MDTCLEIINLTCHNVDLEGSPYFERLSQYCKSLETLGLLTFVNFSCITISFNFRLSSVGNNEDQVASVCFLK